ncbi:MAG: hypothetical protein ACK53Y_19145, partial [bacterium]
LRPRPEPRGVPQQADHKERRSAVRRRRRDARRSAAQRRRFAKLLRGPVGVGERRCAPVLPGPPAAAAAGRADILGPGAAEGGEQRGVPGPGPGEVAGGGGGEGGG